MQGYYKNLLDDCCSDPELRLEYGGADCYFLHCKKCGNESSPHNSTINCAVEWNNNLRSVLEVKND